MIASIKDVARESGVSIATVSRIVAGKENVREETRLKVRAAIEKLGYRPNRAAQQLREQKSRILALLLSDIQNPFFGELARAVEASARQRGLCVFIGNTDEDAEREAEYLELFAREQVAGMIISPSTKTKSAPELFRKVRIPAVLVDRLVGKGIDAVLADNSAAAAHLTERVLQGGYQRIACIFGENSFTSNERLHGVRDTLAAHGQELYALERTPAFEAEGAAAMHRLMALDPRPDAVICSSALLATGAYFVLHEAGLRIPETMGFTCFDDPPWAKLVTPGITVIRQPAALMGEAAAEMLIKRIENPQRPPSLLRLQSSLIERGSLR